VIKEALCPTVTICAAYTAHAPDQIYSRATYVSRSVNRKPNQIGRVTYIVETKNLIARCSVTAGSAPVIGVLILCHPDVRIRQLAVPEAGLCGAAPFGVVNTSISWNARDATPPIRTTLPVLVVSGCPHLVEFPVLGRGIVLYIHHNHLRVTGVRGVPTVFVVRHNVRYTYPIRGGPAGSPVRLTPRALIAVGKVQHRGEGPSDRELAVVREPVGVAVPAHETGCRAYIRSQPYSRRTRKGITRRFVEVAIPIVEEVRASAPSLPIVLALSDGILALAISWQTALARLAILHDSCVTSWIVQASVLLLE
jgi:hypothetical protein